GNGVAAVSAMEAFRERDKSTPIIVISEEPYLAYHRTRLSGFLGSDTNIEKLLLHPPNWYEEKNIHIRHDKKVTSIDNMNKLVTLDKGERLNFSKLLICTGSSAFVPAIPGADLPGVFSIRTLDDIKNFYEFCKDKTNGVIIGGGVLGLEAA